LRAALGGVPTCGGEPADARPEKDKPMRQGRLPELSSKAGTQVEKINPLRDDEWLDLGAPAADPKWGKARGRSWCGPMPHAWDLGGAFLFGKGVHGCTKADGHYMDDLWFYDAIAHRWAGSRPTACTSSTTSASMGAAGRDFEGQLCQPRFCAAVQV
jgi:hypothetical protein